MTDHKVAIVTAASRGMGKASACALAQAGYRLVLLARGDDIHDLAQELGAQAVLGSVTDVDALKQTVETALEHYGHIDGVVNNTGHPPKGELLDITDEDWHAGLDLALLNVVRMARLVTPHLVSRGAGSIVNISTFGAEEPSLKFPVSSAIRASLSAFTKMFATRHAASGVRMNNVLPGLIDSYPVDDDGLAQIPTARAGTTAEIGSVVSFLISDNSSYITGQNIRVDGGLTRSI